MISKTWSQNHFGKETDVNRPLLSLLIPHKLLLMLLLPLARCVTISHPSILDIEPLRPLENQ